jgi:signal transduction histidine kinase
MLADASCFNPYFVGRNDVLRVLASTLRGSEHEAIGPRGAVTGFGGIGKTSVAAEFVHRYGSYFAGGVFWLSFADHNAIESEIAACCGPGLLDLQPSFSDLTLDEQVQAMQQNGNQCFRLLQDIYQIMRLRTGENALHCRDLNLRRHLDRALEQGRPGLHTAGITLNVQHTDPEMTLYADATYLDLMLSHLRG